MLWFDNDPKTALEQKIQKATKAYLERHGSKPDICYVNPDTLKEPTVVEGIVIRPLPSVLPGQLWIGLDDATPGSLPKWIRATGRFDPAEIASIQDIWENHFDKMVDNLLASDPIVTLRAMIEIMINTDYIRPEPKFDSLLKDEKLSAHWAKFLTDRDTDDHDHAITLLKEMYFISEELMEAQAARIKKATN